MNEYKTSALGTSGTPQPDASGTGMIEVAAPSGALAVTTGSNPASVGVLDMLEWKWRSIAAQHRGDAEKTISAIHRTRLNTAAETLEACALELRLLTGATTERQPESNPQGERRA